MKPHNLKTKIFLDSGDPAETKRALDILGFLDGQTTNPSLVANHPMAKDRLNHGFYFSKQEVNALYRDIVREISDLIPFGSVSIEVYADKDTYADHMLGEARVMNSWIPNAHIKLPATQQGLLTAKLALRENMKVNITLCFTQEQAAAVYLATNMPTLGQGDVFVSPFVGRLDDRGENGLDLIKNIKRMYRTIPNCRVEVLTASVRTLNHFLHAIKLGSDIITAPLKVLEEWADISLAMPSSDFKYKHNLKEISYRDVNMRKEWFDLELRSELTNKGQQRFADDWNAMTGDLE